LIGLSNPEVKFRPIKIRLTQREGIGLKMADVEEEKVAGDEATVIFKKRGKFQGRRRQRDGSSDEGVVYN
jgi:hypothetical protein